MAAPSPGRSESSADRPAGGLSCDAIAAPAVVVREVAQRRARTGAPA